VSLYVFTCECGREVRGKQGVICPDCHRVLTSEPQVPFTPPKWASDAARAIQESKKP